MQQQQPAFQDDLLRERAVAQVKRANDLGEYTVSLLKSTLDNAARTYKVITIMNATMFALGIGLFITAAVYGILAPDAKIYSLLFGGLGGATFVAIFFTGSIEKTQVALSNLVQVQVGFMSFFEQMMFWETFGLLPMMTEQGPIPDPARLAEASENLQKRATETVQLLQTFVEDTAR